MTWAVQAEGLSKQYRIGERGAAYDTLREQLVRLGKAAIRGNGAKRELQTIWALRDVSFEVSEGEVLGVIGRNGAGKTTLLKILSRITEPTEGYADVRGRLGSLLEVGTGFHPELTGRENIFLNGAILGMRRAEVRKRFDEIAEFAGVQRFLDTPVKRYSSGMYVRLAFSVAAHFEPEILVVDEVLAVGDAEFQKKSLGKMREVTGEGRTVIFVSHNMASIRGLCDRAILLGDGRIVLDGDVDLVTTRYLSETSKASASGAIPERVPRLGTGEARFTRVRLLDRDRRPLSAVFLGQPFVVSMTLDVPSPVEDAVVEVGISTLDGTRVCTSLSEDGEQPPFRLVPGTQSIEFEVDIALLPGHYTIDLGVHHTGHGSTIDWVERILDFEALNMAEDSADSYRYGTPRGWVRARGAWFGPREGEPNGSYEAPPRGGDT